MIRLIFDYYSLSPEINHYIKASDWYNILNNTFRRQYTKINALFGFYQVFLHCQISVLSVL